MIVKCNKDRRQFGLSFRNQALQIKSILLLNFRTREYAIFNPLYVTESSTYSIKCNYLYYVSEIVDLEERLLPYKTLYDVF